MPNPIPENYPRMMPYLTVQGAADAMDFYADVFGATQRGDRFTMPDGSIAHAELQLGDSVIMLADENKEFGNISPKSLGGTAVTLMVYVEDVDATVEKAVSKGATLTRPASDEFYGDRVGNITDPFGHVWHVASHIEDVSEKEMAKRVSDMFSS